MVGRIAGSFERPAQRLQPDPPLRVGGDLDAPRPAQPEVAQRHVDRVVSFRADDHRRPAARPVSPSASTSQPDADEPRGEQRPGR